MTARAFSLGVSIEVMMTRREPKSRMLRVSFLVSIPEIPGISFSSRYSERVSQEDADEIDRKEAERRKAEQAERTDQQKKE